ncbi:DNA-(apurinic or apyrimidinic site) lyase 2 [Cyanidiococcus yangmingshanensis]|uniref:DNA-(Apurinic or apyrimidinic site) lyase 2 n=1 Tax=Cyanidiococcus yangmingshanensis TaxID=2690220 RepID=A0A7J7IEG1_9RHOD|nr:DNA-(apurinic or apyrimidinic site) lyase 2 [Cyanidiococcus yangmingshanensis]
MTNEAVMMGSLPAWVSFNSPSVERAPMISASYDESEPHSIIQRSSILSDCSNTAEAAVRKRITFEEHPSRGWLHRMLGDDLFRDLFREHWPDRRDAYSCWNTQTQARMTNYGTRIDYILMSRNADTYLQSSACDLLPKVMGSDHCPCMVELVPLVDTEHWPWHCSRPCVPLRYRYRFREKQTSLRRLWQAASFQRDGAVLDPSQGDMHPGESSFQSAGNERPARNREAKASEFALEHRERCRKSDLSVSMPVLHTRCAVEHTDPCRRDGISEGANAAPITRQGDRKRHETDHTARLCRAEQRPVRPERSKPDCSNGCELISTSAVSRAGRGTKRTSLLAWQSGTDLTASAVTSHQKSPESEVTGGTRSTTTGMAGAVGPSPLEPGPYQVKQRSIAALSREMFRGTRSQIQGMVVAAGNAPSSTLPSGCTSTDIAGSAEAEGTCSYVQTSNANHVHGAEAQTIARASSPSLQTRETSKTLHQSVHRTSDASVAGSLPDTQATLEQRPYQVDSRSDAVSESKPPAETMVIRTHAARSPNRNNTHSTRVQRPRMNLACERAPQATLERFLQKPQESVALTEEEETTLTEAARAAQPTPKPSDEFGKGAQASLQRTDMEGWQALLSITCGRAGQRELPGATAMGSPLSSER